MIRRLRSAAEHTLARLGFELRRIRSEGQSSPASLFPPRFSTDDVRQTLLQLRLQQPRAIVWTLSDGYVPVPEGANQVIDCRTADTAMVAGAEPGAVFLYACDSDDIGLPWIRAVTRAGLRFYPVAAYRPSTYAQINDVARATLEAEFVQQQAEGFAKWDFGPGDFLNIIQAIDITSVIAGSYVEVGCYRGSSSATAVRYMNARKLARSCWFFDTFDGFSYEAANTSSDAIWQGTHATEGEAAIRARIVRRADPDRGLDVTVRRLNVVEEQLPAEISTVAVANIDVDLYEAVKAALEKLAPRIAPGGILIVEDPGHTPALIGSRLALAEFLESGRKEQFTPVYLESGQTFLIRR